MTYIDTWDDDYDPSNAYGDIEPDAQDYASDRDYCRHGRYVGNPWGADYMCGYCESGISDEDYEAMVKSDAEQRGRKWEVEDEGVPLYSRMVLRLMQNEYVAEDALDFYLWMGEQTYLGRQNYIRSGK